jgi:hypothetical protein
MEADRKSRRLACNVVLAVYRIENSLCRQLYEQLCTAGTVCRVVVDTRQQKRYQATRINSKTWSNKFNNFGEFMFWVEVWGGNVVDFEFHVKKKMDFLPFFFSPGHTIIASISIVVWCVE